VLCKDSAKTAVFDSRMDVGREESGKGEDACLAVTFHSPLAWQNPISVFDGCDSCALYKSCSSTTR